MGDVGTAIAERAIAPPVRTGNLHVVLTTEGTYPHFRGGVSTWCENLLRGMPDVDFTVWALMMNPFVAAQYPFPPNVRRFIGVPLWGIEEPVEYTPEVPAAKVVTLARLTTERRASEAFVPLLEAVLREISAQTFDPIRFGRLLYDLHLYFRDNDYRSVFRTRAAWETVKRSLLEITSRAEDAEGGIPPEGGPRRAEVGQRLGRLFRRIPRADAAAARNDHVPTVNDAVEGMRWMYRLLMSLNVPIPTADLVHTSAAAFCGIPGILAKIEHGTPLLVTEHGVYMREQYLAMGRYGFPYHLKKLIVQMVAALSRTCFAYADQVSPVCEFNARWELRNGARRDMIRVIYNGVDPVTYVPRAVPRPASPTVVSLSRIDPLKDLETLLRVADVLRQRVSGVQFLHYGPVADERYASTVRALHRSLGLEDTVRFMGGTPTPANALNQADVVLLTSMSEAFPYTVIEAMMCGKPVVSTDVGGVREALEGVGILARAGDVENLAEGVFRLLSLDPAARSELSRACRDRALNLFTLTQAVGGYAESYARLAASRGEGPSPESGPPPAVEEYPGPASGLAPAAPPAPEPSAPDHSRRLSALEAAYREGGETLADVARNMLRDPHPEVRRRAAAALASTPIPKGERVRLLSGLLAGDPDAGVRSVAALGLAALIGEADEEDW